MSMKSIIFYRFLNILVPEFKRKELIPCNKTQKKFYPVFSFSKSCLTSIVLRKIFEEDSKKSKLLIKKIRVESIPKCLLQLS
jgi:hypothetical protein